MIQTILVTEPIEIAVQAIQLLIDNNYTTCTPTDLYNPKQIVSLFIRTYTKATSAYLAQFPHLQFILRAGVGLDNIDLIECDRRQIKVFNAPGSNANAVAEYALAMMLTLLRNIFVQMELVKHGEWRNFGNIGTELTGKVVGLIGCGAVGKNLAGKLQSFGTKIIGYDAYVEGDVMKSFGIQKCELSELLAKSDIVSVNVPLTSETTAMISLSQFHQMKRSSILINVSRGEVINEIDLITALTDHLIAGAAIDVVANEPNINPNLLHTPNLIITPHVAGFTKEAHIAMAMGAVRNFLSSTSHVHAKV